ncbi:MAG: DUF2500 domain-containing protein [Oscillospiraceae bacterium]|nr:DUF2500 domain-containing protein [Oscillospiraceae bacterium]
MDIVRVGFQFHNILFTVMSLAIFGLAVGIILSNLIRTGKQWKKDNDSPRLTVPVTVVAKRYEDIHRRSKAVTSGRSRYYATFEVESGDRMELELEGQEYGLIVEGDRGNLTFQGSRFLKFERT